MPRPNASQTLLKRTERHVDFLRGTLIPDLRESGRTETAKDFETCCKLLVELSQRMNDAEWKVLKVKDALKEVLR